MTEHDKALNEPPAARSAADEFNSYIQAEIDRAPEPLRRLGEWLADRLDEDDWAIANRLLNGAVIAANSAAPPSEPPAALATPYVPTYGAIPWRPLTEVLSEARGVSFSPDENCYIGHQIVPTINFNSLNRIVSAFAAKPAPPSEPPAAQTEDGEPLYDNAGRIVAYRDSAGNIGWVLK
jgi:hypothetical protein